jgi:curved DNA-binding protein CbpA
LKDYYALLEVARAASADEIKRSFRAQIARYHPDKVQHLGKEFQAMAAERAAELTEAWRILSDAGRKAEYDRVLAGGAALTPGQPAPPPPQPQTAPKAESASPRSTPKPPEPEPPPPNGGKSEWFSKERASKDQYVRQATLSRFQAAFDRAMGKAYDAAPVRGFDVSYVPKKSFFGGAKGPRLLGRFVPAVDPSTVADTWSQVSRLNPNSNDEICVFLMGSAMAPRRELEEAISKERRRNRPGLKVNLIPIDTRVWDAHVPADVPSEVKSLLANLKGGR